MKKHLISLIEQKGYSAAIKSIINAKLLRLYINKKYVKRPWKVAPTSIDLAITNACNLRCHDCTHGYDDYKIRNINLSYQAIKKIFNEVGTCCINVNLTPNQGEAFMHPNIYDIISEIKSYGIFVHSDTNGHKINAQYIIKSGLDSITFSVDGFSQESYSHYRVGGDFKTVISNIIELNNKIKESAAKCRIKVKWCVNSFNENEILEAKTFFDREGIPFFLDTFRIPSPSWLFHTDCPYCTDKLLYEYWCPKQYIDWDNYFFDSSDGFYKEKHLKKPFSNICNIIYSGAFITADGSLYPCCNAAYYEKDEMCYGNITERNLRRVFNGEDSAKFRLKYKLTNGDFSLCSTCMANRK